MPHGILDTPGYVALATNATLKSVDFQNADKAGQQVIFSNTYHLIPARKLLKRPVGFTNGRINAIGLSSQTREAFKSFP
jgi:tRNA-guanine family transglycosylase